MNLLDSVCSLAEGASNAILSVYQKPDFEVLLKSDNSPVTEADLKASALLVEGLKRISGLPVLSEEEPVPFDVRKTWERFWLVDPLDGTKDFIKRDGEFTVNIALVEGGVPVLGVVAVPALGLIYTGEKGKGAHRRHGQTVTPISYAPSGSDLICADSRFHSAPETEEFCRINGISRIERFGSALKACRLAEGKVDVYPRFGTTMEWDTAASQIIVEEAGCIMAQIGTRTPLRYNKEDLRNPSFWALPAGLSLRLS